MMYDTAMTAAFTLFFFKQKTAYEMRISDWSSDVCSSDLRPAGEAGVAGCAACAHAGARRTGGGVTRQRLRKRPDARLGQCADDGQRDPADPVRQRPAGRSELSLRLRRADRRSEEHTSELQSLMRISYAVFCLKTKQNATTMHK